MLPVHGALEQDLRGHRLRPRGQAAARATTSTTPCSPIWPARSTTARSATWAAPSTCGSALGADALGRRPSCQTRRGRLCRHAHRHLERQFDHRPAAEAAGLAGEHRHGRAVPPGGQGAPPSSSRPTSCASWATSRRSTPTGRWNGVAVISRVGLERRGQGPARRPGYDGVRGAPGGLRDLRPGPRLVGVRAQRPRGRPPALRLQARVVRGAEGRRRRATRPAAARSRCWATTTSRRPTRTSGTVAVFEGATHVTPAERAALAALREAGLSDVVPAPPQVRPPVHVLGLPPALLPQEPGHAHRPGLRQRAVRQGGQGRYVDREERKGKGASDHAPVVVDLDV